MRSSMLSLAVLSFALGASGCAWMFKGSRQDVEFTSNPDGADVRVDARYLGATPTKGSLDRNGAANIVVSKEGYEKQYARVQRHPDTAWWFWDVGTCVIPVTLCIPLLVDAISGAWFSLDDDVRVKLDAVAAPATAVATSPPAVRGSSPSIPAPSAQASGSEPSKTSPEAP